MDAAFLCVVILLFSVFPGSFSLLAVALFEPSETTLR
jgi:hypothetical protein